LTNPWGASVSHQFWCLAPLLPTGPERAPHRPRQSRCGLRRTGRGSPGQCLAGPGWPPTLHRHPSQCPAMGSRRAPCHTRRPPRRPIIHPPITADLHQISQPSPSSFIDSTLTFRTPLDFRRESVVAVLERCSNPQPSDLTPNPHHHPLRYLLSPFHSRGTLHHGPVYRE
jgi:hypothetical protein